jgi:hypothetical protein
MADASALLAFGNVKFLSADSVDLANSIFYPGSLLNGGIHLILSDVDADGVPTEDLAIYGALQALGNYDPNSTTAPTIDLLVARNY